MSTYETAAETIEKVLGLLDQIWKRSCPPKPTRGPAGDEDRIPTAAEIEKDLQELSPDLQDNLHASSLLQELHDEIAADMVGVLDWHYLFRPEDGLPDDDTRVFVAVRGEDHLIEAFLSTANADLGTGDILVSKTWICDGTLELLADVYAWAHIPELPLDLEEAAKEEGIEP